MAHTPQEIEIEKAKQEFRRNKRAITDMINSEGWQKTFPLLMQRLRNKTFVDNLADEVDLRAAQKLNDVFTSWLNEIYGIVITEEELMQEPDDEFAKVLSGADESSPDEF